MSAIELASGGAVWKLLMSAISGYSSARKNYHDEYIEPLMRSVAVIHKDYTDGLEETRRLIQQNQTPPGEIVEFLRKRRRECETDRTNLRAMSDALNEHRKIVVMDVTWVRVEKFLDACAKYTCASSDVSNFTWFSRYVDHLDAWARQGLDDPWVGEENGSASGKNLLAAIDATLSRDLPSAFSKVSHAYAKLKVRLI